MAKPTVYLDTNIVPSYWYDGSDAASRTRRNSAREWWTDERKHFSVWVSAATEDELAAGRFRRQADCLRFVRQLPYLTIGSAVRQFALELVERRVIPEEKPGDALQMAACAVHGIDYLLSWNYAHVVNPIAQAQLRF